MANVNILSKRYATPEMNDIFSEKGRNFLERVFWIEVMKAQRFHGVDIPEEVITKYVQSKHDIDLDLIESIEKERRHDIKAKIEAFVKAANTEQHLHKRLTSRDLSDNVDQIQVKKATDLVFGKYVSVLRHFLDKADEYKKIILTARTHHQPAQPTLLGRRFTMWAEELHHHLLPFGKYIHDYPMRGIKGPTGTQFDMISLLGSKEKALELEKSIAYAFKFKKIIHSPGQIYFRSLDQELLSHLSLLGAACSNFAQGMRLMSGYELVTEGFKEGQVGSTAMPHKMNTRSSERIYGFANLLKMYVDGASRISGDQWEEGDVSDSVVRRVVIPDAFYVSVGLCETTLTVLNEMGAYPHVINKELERYFPFLATTEILGLAINAGIGREDAHKIIKNYSVEEALNMRNKGAAPRLVKRLAQDPIFQQAGITEQMINNALEDKQRFISGAYDQMDRVKEEIKPLFYLYKDQAAYEPQEIL